MELAERIKDKARELYKKFGLRSVTMDEIASALGISKKTIYTIYADKEALVEAVILSELELNENQCNLDRAKASNAIHEIFLAMEMMQKTFLEMNPALIHDLKKYHPSAYAKFEQFKDIYLFNVIKENIERGKTEDLYRSDINPDIMTILRLESMMLGFNPDLFPAKDYDMAQIQRELILHFLFGISSIKGSKLISKYLQEQHKMNTL